MIELKRLCLTRGSKVLLDDANLRLEKNYRLGLIGRNGAGKSSLMQLLLGNISEDAGEVSLEIRRNDIAYLEQELPDSEMATIDYVKTGDHAWCEIHKRLQQAEIDEDGQAIAHCYEQLQDIDGYTIEARAGQVLDGLGFTKEEFFQPVNSFSGGWQMRMQLAKLLLSRAELLLLDEPTNHLDVDAIVWLEDWLVTQRCSVLLISHDRDFLDTVCTHIVHMAQQQLKVYTGHYTNFTKQFELQLELESRLQGKIEKKRAHMQTFVDRFRYTASKAKQAQSRLKAIEKLTSSPGLQAESPFYFEFFPCKEVANPMLRMDADLGYDKDNTIVKNAKFSLDFGDRVALLGQNGEGKSTFIKSVAGDLPLLGGEVFRHNNISIGYFSQQQLDSLDYSSTPLKHLLALDPKINEGQARKYLGGFAFTGNAVLDCVEHFSGGEKARLALALLIYQKPNLLLLDEPTNHLDIQMREALILALQKYDGAVAVVSHDRHFLNSVVDTYWWVSKGKLAQFDGDLDSYKDMVLSQKRTSENAVKKDNGEECEKGEKSERPKSRQTLKALAKLETKIKTLTAKIDAIEVELADKNLYSSANAAKLAELSEAHKNFKMQLLEVEEKWLRLSA